MQFFSFVTLLLLLAVTTNAVKVFRIGNRNVPVTGTAKEKDFGPLNADGQFEPGKVAGGLSTSTIRESLFGGGATKVWSIDSAAIEAGGFNFVEDGKDVGGTNAPGHRSIAITTAITPGALLSKLNGLPWTAEPDIQKNAAKSPAAKSVPVAKAAAPVAKANPPAKAAAPPAKVAAPAPPPAKAAAPVAPAPAKAAAPPPPPAKAAAPAPPPPAKAATPLPPPAKAAAPAPPPAKAAAPPAKPAAAKPKAKTGKKTRSFRFRREEVLAY